MKRFATWLATILGSLTFFAAPALANPAYWTLQISNPFSSTGNVANSRSFNLSVSVSSAVAGDEIAVKVYQNDSLVVGSFSETSATYGASWNVPITVTTDGTYTYKMVAQNSNGDPVKESSTTVIVDATSPQSPGYASKKRAGNTYTVNFTAPAGDVKSVKVFASTSPSFVANAATQVGVLSVTPGQQVSFSYIAPDTQERYFAVQAFDSAGNSSALTGDSVVSGGAGTATSTTTNSSTAAASNSKVASNNTTQTPKSNTQTKSQSQENKSDEKKEMNWTVVWITLGVLAVLYAAYRWFMREVDQA